MSKYAFIVAGDYKYTIELCALLGSLHAIGNKSDVHLIGVHLPEEFTSQFNKLCFNLIHHDIKDDEISAARGISEICCRKRYHYAVGIGQNYESVCILDADMIFNRDPWQFFEIAAKTGFIIGCNREQNQVYDDPHQQADGEWIIPKGTWNTKDLTNCPLFLDTKVWGEPLKRSWDIFLNHNFKAPDMSALNTCLIAAGAHDKIVKVPNIQWLSTNEAALKPYQRITVRRDGKLWSENGLEIFSYHGQFYYKKWRETQLANRKHCIAGRLNGSVKAYNDSVGALEVLTKNFFKMLDLKDGINVEHRDYRHDERGR